MLVQMKEREKMFPAPTTPDRVLAKVELPWYWKADE
jgi:hypothetical protein